MPATLPPKQLAAILVLVTGTALVGAEPQPESRLGGDQLTPLGAERAGNAAGIIPAWNGGISEPLPELRPGEHHPDPFPDDEIKFTITADNLADHADKLSPGQVALLQKYPATWYINVYPTRRSASFPKFAYDALKTNATQARLISEGLGGVRGAKITSPFPMPENGVEVVWNHLLRWRGVYSNRINGEAAVTRKLGLYRIIFFQEETASAYANPVGDAFQLQRPYLGTARKRKVLAPGSEAGLGILNIEPVDYTQEQRQSWIYNPNLRRVMRNPRGGFDNPAPQSDGLRLADEFDMFSGSPALFEWKLLGKQELYIPYNSYRLHSAEIEYGDILHKSHINPKLARYELHRVWVVEGTVRNPKADRNNSKLETRGHVYSRRVFYVDEDSWQIAVADSYDSKGALWRVAEGHMVNYYQVPAPWYTLEVFHDLQQGRYLASGLDNDLRSIEFGEAINWNSFSPLALDFYTR